MLYLFAFEYKILRKLSQLEVIFLVSIIMHIFKKFNYNFYDKILKFI